jgi:hypothetical protein
MPYIEKGKVDNIFQTSRRLYIQKPELINTPSALSGAESLRLYNGEALVLEGVSKVVPNSSSSKKTKKSSKKADLTTEEAKRLAEIKATIDVTDRAYWLEVLKEYGQKGQLENIRNSVLRHIFRREVFFNHGDCIMLIDEIMSNKAVKGDRDRKNLESYERTQSKKILNRLRQDAQNWAIKHPEQTFRFKEIDLKNRDWSDLKTKRAAAIKSGCGTNKTKGVIYDLVKWSKETDQSCLIVSPFIAVTEAIAKEVGINHYHSFGTSKQNRLKALTSPRMATCYQSLNVLDALKKLPHFDIVIIDEASLVWRGQDDSKEFKRSLELLYKICDSSKHTYALCADIDEHTLWCLEQIENHKAESFALYLNSADWGKDYEIEHFEDYEMVLQNLIDSLNKGKRVAIAVDESDKKGWITGFKKLLQNHCSNAQIRGFDAETVQLTELKVKANETISKWLEEGMDCLIVSPFCSVGWDYLDTDHVFDEVFVIGTNGFLSAQRLWQWIRRFRLTRKAKFYLRENNELIFDRPTRKVVEREKLYEGRLLTRKEDWEINTRDALKLDQANVGWYFRELCKDKGARLTTVLKPEEKEGEERETPLKNEFGEIRKKVKEQLLDKLRTEQEEYLKLIESFGFWRDEFVQLNETHYLDDKELAALTSRNINEVKAERFCRCLSWDEADLKILDNEEIIEFNVLLYKTFSALWYELRDFIPDKYPSFAHWYTQSDKGEIYGEYRKDNFISVQAILKRHWTTLKEELPYIGRDCLLEPNRVLSSLVRSLDLSLFNKKEKNINAIEAKKELYEYYQETSEPNFRYRAKDREKLKFCLENCYRKQKEGVGLSPLEIRFLQSRPSSFTIRRKKYISKYWFERMDRARKVFDDRNEDGVNHTRYCSCKDCLKERLIN